MLSISFQHSRQDARTPIVFMWERFSQPQGSLRPLCKIWFSTSHLTHIEVVNLICRVNHQPDSKQFNQSCPSIMNVMIVVVLGNGCLKLIASGYGYTQITQCMRRDFSNPKLVVFLSRFCACSLSVNISCRFLQSSPLHIYIFLNYTSAPFTFQLPRAASVISTHSLHICFLDDSFHWSAGASTGPIMGEVHIFSDYWLRADICLYLGVGTWTWLIWFGCNADWTLEAWRGGSPHRILDGKTTLNEVWPSLMQLVLCVTDSK